MLQPLPPGFKDNKYSFSFSIYAPESKVWEWLNNTRTFTDTQIWPWRVEFYSPNPETQSGFNQGVLTNHHGPLINLAGELIEVIKNKYRDLQYNYGSYALSFRLIRPYRLEFETNESDGKTEIKGTLSAYVKPGISNLWTSAQRVFWNRFKKWSTKSILKAKI